MEWHGILYYSIYRRERERKNDDQWNGMELIKMEEEQGIIIVQYHIVL